MQQPLERYENPSASMEPVITWPNALTMAGYIAGLAWVAGAPSWAAVASITLDELDGYVARKLGQESELGSNLDWATDLSLTGFCLLRVGAPWWLIPFTTAWQVYAREHTIYPPILSLRAAVMIYGILQEQR